MFENSSMQRVNLVLNDPDYIGYIKKNESAETNRPFCGHDFEHLLNTARLSWIFLLEAGNPFITREIAYVTALLHDIGRWVEYLKGGDHALTSARLAEPLLKRAGFSRPEISLVTRAIAEHRLSDDRVKNRSALSAALYQADQHARLCFYCPAAGLCHKLERQPHKTGLQY